MTDYDPSSLREGIKTCKKNIEIYEQAIENERDTIASYRVMIDQLELKARLAKGITIDADPDN